jgi:SAM-dependent methyltransferase
VTAVEFKLDWQKWFERWERMQNCYIPRRLDRFALMLKLPGFPREAEVRILDLGCGPGSLSIFALEHYPNARIVAVDFDPVLLAMGREVVGGMSDRIEFKHVDIREGGWWGAYEGAFDLVLSATALHWLSAERLAQTYRRVYRALKPGGWFLNSDHVASDSPEMQARYRRMLQERQEGAFRATGADDWDGFWEALRKELRRVGFPELRSETESWEGSEDGRPRQFCLDSLRGCRFEQVEVHWQELGEAVIGARKPAASAPFHTLAGAFSDESSGREARLKPAAKTETAGPKTTS